MYYQKPLDNFKYLEPTQHFLERIKERGLKIKKVNREIRQYFHTLEYNRSTDSYWIRCSDYIIIFSSGKLITIFNKDKKNKIYQKMKKYFKKVEKQYVKVLRKYFLSDESLDKNEWGRVKKFNL